MGIVTGTLVFGTRTLYAKHVYQGAVGRYWRNWHSLKILTVLGHFIPIMYTDLKGQTVGKFYDFWCNWRF